MKWRALVIRALFGTALVESMPSHAFVQLDEYLMHIDRYRYDAGAADTRWYSLVTAMTQEHVLEEKFEDTEKLRHVPDFMPRLLDYLDRWLLYIFDRAGTANADSERYRILKTTGSFNDRRSAFVFISELNDLTKIKAMLRVQRLGSEPENQKLSLEKHLGIEVERPEQELVLENGRLVVTGDIAELKNFSHVQDAEFDFVPLLFKRAREHGLFGAGLRRATYRGESYPLVPSLFYLHCDLAEPGNLMSRKNFMLHYYKHLGFEIYKISPETKTVVMRITRAKVFEIEKLLHSRPGQALIERGEVVSLPEQWELAPPENFSCERISKPRGSPKNRFYLPQIPILENLPKP